MRGGSVQARNLQVREMRVLGVRGVWQVMGGVEQILGRVDRRRTLFCASSVGLLMLDVKILRAVVGGHKALCTE